MVWMEKKVNIRRLLTWSAVALLAMAAVLVPLLTNCNGREPQTVRDEHYMVADSTLRAIGDVDSLSAMVQRYHSAGDAVGEMLACRYLGEKHRELSNFSEAIKVHEQGYKLAVSLADTLETANALNCIGNDYRRQGELSTADGYYYQTLKLCDAYNRPNEAEAVKCRVVALNGIAYIETELCNYATADSLLHEALEGEIMLGNDVGIAKNYGNLGLVKCNQGDADSAWYYYRKSMDYNTMSGDELGKAMCHLRFGELREGERAFYHAIEEYKQAYDILKQLDNKWHIMDASLALASLNIKLGEIDEARHYLLEAEAMAERTGSKSHQAQVHMVHYELSMAEGKHEEALHHYIIGDEIFDSVYGLKRNDEIRSQRLDYQRQRLNGELNVLNSDIQQLKRSRNMQLLFTLLLLVMAGAIIAALTYAMRVRARTQRLLRQVEETRSLFFTNVVHQLRTPLTAIMGSIDVIIDDVKSDDKKNSLKPEQYENLYVIERQGKNLLMLVDRILEVGSVRSALKDPEWRTGDAVTLIRMILESYREKCIERHIELTYVPRENDVVIDTVPTYLITIVSRLIENAIQYSRDYSKITVTSHVDDDMLIIKVADNGIGISEKDLPHVFEPFYRGAAAEQLVDGVGIGLTVVRDMTMAMGGTVTAESPNEQGTVITAKLPCRHGNGLKKPFDKVIKPILSISGGHSDRSTAQLAPEQQGTGKPVILVIEDHNDVARLVGKVLNKNYEVHYAQDGEQGLAMAGELKPDLIVTDVKMPNMDGYELCREVRSMRQLCHIPIIMLSARTSNADRVKGIEAGADAYLVKPFNPQEMCAWVSRLMDCRRQLREVYAAPARDAAAGSPVPVLENIENNTEADDRQFLKAFNAEVNKHMAEGIKLDLDKMARTFKMGESQLRRKVQQLTGKNISSYIMMLRMEKAMSLLCRRTDLLVGEVAERCGFVDVAYFSRVFRQHYGMTPTQARNTTDA